MNEKHTKILAQLHPDLRAKIAQIMAVVPVVPVCGFRSLDEQAALYAKGRTKPGAKVTWARPGESPHNFNPPRADGSDGALACDLVIDVTRVKVRTRPWLGKDYPDAWDDASPAAVAVWRALGVAARAAGLSWGGDWKEKVDKPHVELPNWRAYVRADLRARASEG